ncbi:hybrid signal transduction histidine kinase E-like [Oppia nitens]|uniref:hybrid signal transduction histidine kinase E-like n=1 Tax=Oppia nitens TaxID=1686743 RepID=UPI0023DAA0FB|nr:hybrid signal transduction histidine kinase E-like [Oppia nitens]
MDSSHQHRYDTTVNTLTATTTKTQIGNNSLRVYRLSPDKTQHLTLKKSTQNDGQITDGSTTNGHKKRYLVSHKSGVIYQILDKTPLPFMPLLSREVREPECDLISDDQYFKYIGLIDKPSLNTKPKTELNVWPLRDISKNNTKLTYNPSEHLVLTDLLPTTVYNNINETDNTRDWNQQQVMDKKNDKNSRKRQLRSFRKDATNLITNFDLASYMGRRIYRSLFRPISSVEKYMITISYENYCICDKYLINVSIMSANNVVMNSVVRYSRSLRHYHHSYCFNRKQRHDKWQLLETGINKRSQLLMKRCKRLCLRLNRIQMCPLCRNTVDFEPRHQCWEFEPHLRPTRLISLLQSHNHCPNDELIVVGDDFLSVDTNEQHMNRVSNICITGNNNNNNNSVNSNHQNNININDEVITADDSSDDDIMIIDEVIRYPISTVNNHKMSSTDSVLKKILTQMQELTYFEFNLEYFESIRGDNEEQLEYCSNG